MRKATWVGLCLLLLALTLNFGNLRRTDDSDVWISTLTSLTDLTPYEWGSNRFGTLAPLLARPVSDPIWNHFVQNAFTVAAMLATAFLLPFLKTRADTRAWACACLWGLYLISSESQFKFLTSYSHPYALSIFLGLLGWHWGFQQTRLSRALPGAWLCFMTSLWVNISLGPWLCLLAACHPKSKRAWLLGSVSSFCFALNFAMASQYRYKVTFQFGASRDPLATALALLEHFLAVQRWQALALWLAVSLLALAYLRRNQKIDDFWRVALGLSLASGAHWLVLSSSSWVEANDSHARYMTPVLWSLVIATALPIARALGDRKLPWFCLVLYSLLRFGFATPQAWSARWMAPEAATLDRLENEQVAVLVGNYWTSWQLTYFAYVRAYQAGKSPWLWACTQRSENTRDRWQPQLLAGQPVAFDLQEEAKSFAWLGVVYVPLLGKTFLPSYSDEKFVVGKYLDEAPSFPYGRYEAIVLDQVWTLKDPQVWRYLGQGWDGPDAATGGRFVGAHQADLRFQSPAPGLVLELELVSVAGPQPYIAFLNGEGLTQGTIHERAAQTLRVPLPDRLVRPQNVFSLTFPDAKVGPLGHQFRSVEVFQFRLKEL